MGFSSEEERQGSPISRPSRDVDVPSGAQNVSTRLVGYNGAYLHVHLKVWKTLLNDAQDEHFLRYPKTALGSGKDGAGIHCTITFDGIIGFGVSEFSFRG